MAQPLKTRVVDDGGTGTFKAIAVQERSMSDFVVYRPKDLLHAHARCGAFPLLLFGNGGCSDTSVGYERMLSEVASHGYIVVAIGEMRDSLNERPIGQTESAELMRGMELILKKNRTKGTEYYKGHGGTYYDKYGGDYGRLVLDWLDWHLKDKRENAKVFLTEKPTGYDGWELKAKNFIDFKNVRSLWIENGDRQIYGVLNRPLGREGRLPIAIVSHGFNGTHHFAQDYFGPLAELGWMTYAFDFPCGSVNSRSDSNTMNMSILDEQSDLRAIVNYFRSQPYVDTDRIMLIGQSQGGLVSALTAAQMNKEVSHLLLIYPALCIPNNWNSRYPKFEDIPHTTRLWNVPVYMLFLVPDTASSPKSGKPQPCRQHRHLPRQHPAV